MSHRPDPVTFWPSFGPKDILKDMPLSWKTCEVRVSPSVEGVEFVCSFRSLTLESTQECVAVLPLLHC